MAHLLSVYQNMSLFRPLSALGAGESLSSFSKKYNQVLARSRSVEGDLYFGWYKSILFSTRCFRFVFAIGFYLMARGCNVFGQRIKLHHLAKVDVGIGEEKTSERTRNSSIFDAL
jgi:hypothetical protein